MSSTNVVAPSIPLLSNEIQGPVYTNVLEATISASVPDFIDSGLSLDVLESLRQVLLPIDETGADG
jgi:hypothetical protein